MEKCPVISNSVSHIPYSQQCAVCYIDICWHIYLSDNGQLKDCYNCNIVQVLHSYSHPLVGWHNTCYWNLHICSLCFIKYRAYALSIVNADVLQLAYPFISCFRLFLRRKLSNLQWMAIVLLAIGTTTSQVKLGSLLTLLL